MGRCLVTCPFPSSACRASSSVSLPLLLSCCFCHVPEEKSCPSLRLSLPAGAKRRTNKIVQNAQTKMSNLLARHCRGPLGGRGSAVPTAWTISTSSVRYINPTWALTTSDLWRTVLSFFPLGHFRPFGFLGFRPGFLRPSGSGRRPPEELVSSPRPSSEAPITRPRDHHPPVFK